MKLKNNLTIRHKTAWHMAHRIREAWRENGSSKVAGEIVEIDETWIGGRARNMHRRRRPPRKELLRRKSIVVGAKDRETKEVRAKVVPDRSRASLMPFIDKMVQSGALLCTDSLAAYRDPWGFWHEAVNHKKGEYVAGRGSHERHRVVLGRVQDGIQDLPDDVQEASPPLCGRIRGPEQRAGRGNRCASSNCSHGGWWGSGSAGRT